MRALRAVLAVAFAAACGPPAVEPDTCEATQWSAPPGCAATDFEGKLRCIPGLTVAVAPDAGVPGYTRYNLQLEQPVDHDAPQAGDFPMRLTLLHTDASKPLVLSTSGYGLSSGRGELTRAFATNQLSYEHRFFGPSRPTPTDWTKLSIRQAAGDAHRIAEAFHWLYPGRWVNTGGSKGGMTSVYHRRFHPCDVDATVAYVAPVTLGALDPAYPPFLEQVGGPPRAACRAALTQFQRRLLMEREVLVPLVSGTFGRIPVDQAFELAVIELPFGFWQYGDPDDADTGCGAIPAAGATAQQQLDFLETHSSPEVLAGAASLEAFEPYYHQAATQLGAPEPNEAALRDLLRYPGTDVPSTFVSPGRALPFDAAAMPDINIWLATRGQRLLFVYGSLDPWSARPFTLGLAEDSFTFVVDQGNHGASLSQLGSASTQAFATVSRWLNAALVTAPKASRREAEPERRAPR